MRNEKKKRRKSRRSLITREKRIDERLSYSSNLLVGEYVTTIRKDNKQRKET